MDEQAKPLVQQVKRSLQSAGSHRRRNSALNNRPNFDYLLKSQYQFKLGETFTESSGFN